MINLLHDVVLSDLIYYDDDLLGLNEILILPYLKVYRSTLLIFFYRFLQNSCMSAILHLLVEFSPVSCDDIYITWSRVVIFPKTTPLQTMLLCISSSVFSLYWNRLDKISYKGTLL